MHQNDLLAATRNDRGLTPDYLNTYMGSWLLLRLPEGFEGALAMLSKYPAETYTAYANRMGETLRHNDPRQADAVKRLDSIAGDINKGVVDRSLTEVRYRELLDKVWLIIRGRKLSTEPTGVVTLPGLLPKAPR